MLPGLRLVLVAIAATILFVVLGFAQLVKLQMAQSQSANLAPVEARFAGLAFAARADWTPVPTSRGRSLEALAPFAAPGPMKAAAISLADPVPPQAVPATGPAPADLTGLPAPEASQGATGGLGSVEEASPVDLAALQPPPADAVAPEPTPAIPARAETALPDEAVPMPGPRPRTVVRPPLRKRPAPAQPAASPEPAGSAPSNPLAGLFGVAK